jgi:hypothetical protein
LIAPLAPQASASANSATSALPACLEGFQLRTLEPRGICGSPHSIRFPVDPSLAKGGEASGITTS